MKSRLRLLWQTKRLIRSESCYSQTVYNMKTRRSLPGKINHISSLKSALLIIASEKITCQLLHAVPYVDLSKSIVKADHFNEASNLTANEANPRSIKRNGLSSHEENVTLTIKNHKNSQKLSRKSIKDDSSHESPSTSSTHSDQSLTKSKTKEVKLWRSPRLNKGKNRSHKWSSEDVLTVQSGKHGKKRKSRNSSKATLKPLLRFNLRRRLQKAEASRDTEIIDLSDSGQYSSPSDEVSEQSYQKDDSDRDSLNDSSNANTDDASHKAKEKNDTENESSRDSSINPDEKVSDDELVKAATEKQAQRLCSSDDDSEPNKANNDDVDHLLNKENEDTLNKEAKETANIETDDSSNSDIASVKRSSKVVQLQESEESDSEEKKELAKEKQKVSELPQTEVSPESNEAKRGRDSDSDNIQKEKRSKITHIEDSNESDSGATRKSKNRETPTSTKEGVSPGESSIMQDSTDEHVQDIEEVNIDSETEGRLISTKHRKTGSKKKKVSVTEEVTIILVESDEESANKTQKPQEDSPILADDPPNKRRRLSLGKTDKNSIPSTSKSRLSIKKKAIDESIDDEENGDDSKKKKSTKSPQKKSHEITTEELLEVLSGDKDSAPESTLLTKDTKQLLVDGREDLSTQVESTDKTTNDVIDAEDTENADVTEARNSNLTEEQKSKNKKHPRSSFCIRFAKGFKYSQFECDTCNKLFSTNVNLQLHSLQHVDNRTVEVNLFRASLPLRFNTANQDIEKYLKPRPRRSIKETNVDELKNLVMKYCNNESYLAPFDTYLEGDVSYADMTEISNVSRVESNVTILSNILINDLNNTTVDEDIDGKISNKNVDTVADQSDVEDIEEPNVEHAKTHTECQTNATEKDNISTLHHRLSNENYNSASERISSDSDDFFSVASPTEVENFNLEIQDDERAPSPSRLSDVSEAESLDHTQKICKLDDELHSLLRAKTANVCNN